METDSKAMRVHTLGDLTGIALSAYHSPNWQDALDGWDLLSASDIGLTQTTLMTLDDGQYLHVNPLADPGSRNGAAATVARDGDTLAIAFSGTDSIEDAILHWVDWSLFDTDIAVLGLESAILKNLEPVSGLIPEGLVGLIVGYLVDILDGVPPEDTLDALRDNFGVERFGRPAHYELFSDLVGRLDDYIRNEEISTVLVTGHSLGAAMVTRYMSGHVGPDWRDVSFEALALGNPGYPLDGAGQGPAILNLWSDDDPVQSVDPDATSPGTGIVLRDGFSDLLASHSSEYYRAVADYLDQRGVSMKRLEGSARNPAVENVHLSVEAVDGGFLVEGVSATGPEMPGADLILGSVKVDLLQGGAGTDWVLGGDRGDRLHGGTQDDRVQGERGHDRLSGGRGDDLVIGGRGDDTLRGDAGDDTLRGGFGDDIFVFAAGDGRNTIRDFGRGADSIQIGSGADGLSDLAFGQVGKDVRITFADVELVILDAKVEELQSGDNILF